MKTFFVNQKHTVKSGENDFLFFLFLLPFIRIILIFFLFLFFLRWLVTGHKRAKALPQACEAQARQIGGTQALLKGGEA